MQFGTTEKFRWSAKVSLWGLILGDFRHSWERRVNLQVPTWLNWKWTSSHHHYQSGQRLSERNLPTAFLPGHTPHHRGPGGQLSSTRSMLPVARLLGIFSYNKKMTRPTTPSDGRTLLGIYRVLKDNTRRVWLHFLLPSMKQLCRWLFLSHLLKKCSWAKTHLLVIELKNTSFWLEVVRELLLLRQIYFAFQGFNCTQHGAVLINPSEFNIYSGGVNMLILHASLSWE